MDERQKKLITELIMKVGKGDEQSLVLLYETISARLLSYALSLLKNRADAEDALSETFIRIVKYAASFKKRDNGYGWAATIMRNCCKNILSKRRYTDDIDTAYNLSGDGEPDMSKTDIDTAMTQLDTDEREFIRLRYYNDLTVREIAKQTGIPRSSVMYKLQKAEKKLKEHLKDPDSG